MVFQCSYPKKPPEIYKPYLRLSSVMDEPEPQSLFVVVKCESMGPIFSSSIIQLEINVNNHEYTLHSTPTPKGCPQIKRSLSLSSINTQLNQKEYVANFSQPQGYPLKSWVFSPQASSKEDLYMLPDRGIGIYQTDVPLDGYVFNLRTKMCHPIKAPPKVLRFLGPVVTVRGHIYYMVHPSYNKHAPNPLFQCYNPVNDSWKTLEPFPICQLSSSEGYIVAIAVWDDTILFSFDSCEIWAYNVNKNKRYPVAADDHQCLRFSGRAVVVENTIYALKEKDFGSVLAISVERKQIGGDLVFNCSLRSKINVPDMGSRFRSNEYLVHLGKDIVRIRARHMGQILYPLKEIRFRSSEYLVHLGKDKFYLVQSTMFGGYKDYQPIQVTIIKFDGENSIVIDKCVHCFKLVNCVQFEVVLCFSLPQYKTTAFENGKRFVFALNPFPEDYVSKQPPLIHVIDDSVWYSGGYGW